MLEIVTCVIDLYLKYLSCVRSIRNKDVPYLPQVSRYYPCILLIVYMGNFSCILYLLVRITKQGNLYDRKTIW